MRNLLVWLVVGTFAFPGFGRSYQSVTVNENSSVTYGKLKELMNDEGVISLPSFLRALKKSETFSPILSQNVLLYSSESPEADGVDFAHPRVIAFHENLILALTGKVEDPSYGRVQIIEYLPKEAQFSFHELDFRANAKPVIHDAPTSCVDCHHGRPIWSSYSLWPGAYGSNADSTETSEFKHFGIKPAHDERAKLREFLAKNAREIPYQHFDFQAFGPDHVFLDGHPNSEFTQHVSSYNFHSLYRTLIAHPFYNNYQFAIMAALGECDDIELFLPHQIRMSHELLVGKSWELLTQEVSEINQARNLAKVERLAKDLGIESPSSPQLLTVLERVLGEDQMANRRLNQTVAFRYLLSGMGIELKSYSLDREPGGSSYHFRTPLYGLRDLNYSFFLAKSQGIEIESSGGAFEAKTCRRLRRLSLDNWRQ